MKKYLLLLLILFSINGYNYEKNEGFNYDVGLAVQSTSLEGYKISGNLSGNGYGVYIGAGFHHNFSEKFYIEPMVRVNFNTENLVTGSDNFQNEIDVLSVSTPYNFVLRIGELKFKTYGVELILGMESTKYAVSSDFAEFANGTKSNDISSSNFVYGLRINGYSYENINYGFEFLTQSNSFNPIQNEDDSWDARTSTLSVFFLF